MLCANFQRNLTAHLKDSFPSGKSRVVEKDILYTELAYGSLPELAQYCGLNSRDHPVEGKVPITRGRVRYSTDVNSMYILFLFGLFLSTSYMSRLPVVPSRRKLYSDCRKV